MVNKIKKRARQSLKSKFGLAILGLLIFAVITGVINALVTRIVPGLDQDYLLELQQNPSPETIQALINEISGLIVLVIIVSIAVNVLITSVFQLGLIRYFDQFTLKKEPKLNMLFFGFKESYVFKVKSLILVSIYAFVWFIPYTILVTASALQTRPIVSIVVTALSLVALIYGIYKVLDYALVPYLLADEKETFESASQLIEKSRTLIHGHKMTYVLLGLSFILWFIFGLFTLFIGLLFVIPYVTQSYVEFYFELNPTKLEASNEESFA